MCNCCAYKHALKLGKMMVFLTLIIVNLYILLFIRLLPLFYSCSEIEDLPNVESSVSNVTTRAAGDGVYDVLGYGYDITDDYMGENSTRLKILDVEAFVKANPWRLCRNSVATCLPSGF